MKRVLALILVLLTTGCDQVERLPGLDALIRGSGRSRATSSLDFEALARHRIQAAQLAITRLDVAEAEVLLEGATGAEASREKARLAIYRADCRGALVHLSPEVLRTTKHAADLLDVARRCDGATSGARVVEDHDRGLWIRVQDERDLVFVPLLSSVAVRAREALGKDLGVTLPRPLRIDLVRDLFSLSAVSGLPLEAAETTGTVAVARFGRVTMLSPRAPERSYPWADTLAHELTHLMLSRASADRAPLWLQEGIAKLSEERWRSEWPFDGEPDPARVAYEAEVAGEDVGVTELGPSIAMLPSARAAAIAFAEVRSFMEYWIAENGRPALRLLLRDLSVAPDADAAMRGVSGLSVAEWELLFRDGLGRRFSGESPEGAMRSAPIFGLRRELRLLELLGEAGYASEAAEVAAPAIDRAAHVSSYRFLLARAAARARRGDEKALLGQLREVEQPDAGWLALAGAWYGDASPNAVAARTRSHDGRSPVFDATTLFEQAWSLDPLLREAVCASPSPEGVSVEDFAKLCQEAKQLPEPATR